ncbi:ComF family protein [Polynucleobacter ibericus]|uniref:ComF family protein n=1 Tax=Polynucleobacter ibericus TaxID=1819725 RepID=UPI001BFD47B3|nr:phosphoribosyltransferase family protein [Polynucleobacter ibericus]QWE08539.1 ComF family protein [Polynucleobacter ibericus]
MRIPVNIFKTICEHLLPTACVICQEFQACSICIKCLGRLNDGALYNYQCCYQCGVALHESELTQQQCGSCQSLAPYFDETYCLDRYDGLLRHPLHELKYQKRIAFANALGNTWNLLLQKNLADISADYLLPVPLSNQKLALRGFNQSWEIAKRVRCEKQIQKSPYIIHRHHYSQHQAGSSLGNRYLAIQGMFYVEENYINALQNKTVIVFDDVMTSGATLNEIARVLKDNGVSRVINWVLLRAARPT